uniref:Uncharacterized protein n=1 Tax=Siphoviridae sp. ctwuP1 TaxID=2827972 RepID=A0A8S5TBH7_9CAUD|nr:MAG TPA: hypothetical protein [Siphoviridae sp. ctwuP1]
MPARRALKNKVMLWADQKKKSQITGACMKLRPRLERGLMVN